MVADTENSSCGQVYPSEILSQSPRSGRWESYRMSGNAEFYPWGIFFNFTKANTYLALSIIIQSFNLEIKLA